MIKNLEAHKINIEGEDFLILSNGAMFWEKKNLLLLADSHLGKTHYFNEYGIPIPVGAFQDQLDRLDSAINFVGAGDILVLGDMFHHEKAINEHFLKDFSKWRKSFEGEISCIVGNHDKYLVDLAVKEEVTFIQDYIEHEQLIFAHDFVPKKSGSFQFFGHRHPRFLLKDHGGFINVPCFWRRDASFILPAFSSICTGTAINDELSRDDQIFLALEDEGILAL